MDKRTDPKANVASRDKVVQQQLEQLREEYTKLYEKKISTESDRKNLEEQLVALRDKAEREYGTSDIEQLKTLLEERRLQNEKMVEEYRQHIEGIKQQLEEIEKGEVKKK